MDAQAISLHFEISGKTFSGFCLRINDQFHETYAVVLEGYQSFCIWSDGSKSNWYKSRNARVGTDVINSIILFLEPKPSI